MMTIKQAKELLKDKHMTLRHKDGEYRVNHNGSGEETAYYTNDLTDAVNTAIYMAQNS